MFEQRKLFFIMGLGRSGTTLLQEIMNTFSSFCNLRESVIGVFPNGLSCWSHVRKKGDFSYLEKFIKDNWTDEFFVEKAPGSILCLPQLLEKYSLANYIFLERHPLKIILSALNMFDSEELFDLKKNKMQKILI